MDEQTKPVDKAPVSYTFQYKLRWCIAATARFMLEDRPWLTFPKFKEPIPGIFMISMTVLFYLYGNIYLLPIVVEKDSWHSTLVTAFSTWCLIAFLSHFYLVRKRNPSIKFKSLPPKCPKEKEDEVKESDEKSEEKEDQAESSEVKENSKIDSDDWHMCPTCDILVPPRAWHCKTCNSCQLRRDHHCVFTGCCVGEKNLANFLGFLFYLSSGASLFTCYSFYYYYYLKEWPVWIFFFRMWASIYSFFYDFDHLHFLTTISICVWAAGLAVLLFYFAITIKGQTSFDNKKKIGRTLPGSCGSIDFRHLSEMLGPYPFWKIIWPFHEPPSSIYEVLEDKEREEIMKKNL